MAIVDSKLLDDDLYVKHKRPFTAMKKDVLDLFIENFIPIHSYVLDRNRIDDADLRIREDLTKLEDYEFLLRLCAHHGIDLELAQEPVGEYRIRNDGSNTVEAGCLTPERISEWDLARAEIEQVKKTLTYRSTIYDLAVLGQARMVTRVEAPPPPMISQSIHEVINTPVRLVFYKLGLMLDGQLSRISPLYKVVNGLISGSTILAKRVALRLQRFLRRRR